MPVQAAHKLEPPLAYAASKARQPPKLPRHKPYASCGTYPPNTMPPSVQDEVRARSARKSQKEIHSTTCTLQPHRQRSPACAATFTLSRPPRTPARRNRSRRRASSRVRASPGATDGMQKRTSSQRSRQPRQHSRRLRPRGANCGHCPVRRSVACGHTGLQRCRGSASNHGGCAVQRPPGRCSGPQPLSGREAAPGGTLTSSPNKCAWQAACMRVLPSVSVPIR